MENENTVKYQYATNSESDLVWIGDLPKTQEARNAIYICISCEKELLPVMGEKRQRHFRHVVAKGCSLETYLHKLGKELFFQRYQECLESGSPFEIELVTKRVCQTCEEEFNLSCSLKPGTIQYDLTKKFPLISLEQADEGFIPDLLLSNEQGEKIYIEIAVSHKASERKREAGARIIEIDVASEEDLAVIQDRKLSQSSEQVKFYNFRPQVKTCRINSLFCKENHYFFILKNDGAAFIMNGTVQKLRQRIGRGDVSFSKRVPCDGSGIYIIAVEAAHHAKRLIRNCYLCRYHAENLYRKEGEGPIFCKFLKQKYTSTQAVRCEYYRSDPKVFPTTDPEFSMTHFNPYEDFDVDSENGE